MTSVRTATAVRTAVFNSSGKVVLYVLVFATAGFFALPLVVMVLTSFKEQTQVFAIVIRATGSSASITNREGFRPRSFGRTNQTATRPT